jgi:hypothetical protein
MTTTAAAAPEEDAVDLDLLADDAVLREAIGQPTAVRLPTGKIIDVPHISDWPHIASRYAAIALFDAWAAEVLSEQDQKAFAAAKLKNYQVSRLIERASQDGGTNPGKSRPSSASRRNTRRK